MPGTSLISFTIAGTFCTLDIAIRKFEATEKVWENHIRALLFCSLLEIYPTWVRINQKFRFKSHSLQTFPLVNSHDDQNVVIEPFQHQLISKVKIGRQPRSLCVHTCAMHCTREKTSHSLKYNKKLCTRCRKIMKQWSNSKVKKA